ncbi:MAG: dihydropteroate synthase [Spirochaetaceae bacterium]|nr:dihydropteroate synthase [Spirochaetaceae bacterium]|tara:strand:+ start:370584 stop:371435 length:852 start_codon:yes stop_codon:yes gene_type:complete
MSNQPEIFGIVNITTDSFSDGGKYLDQSSLGEHINKLTRDGANTLDLGAASSNPEANPVDPLLEMERLDRALDIIAAAKASGAIPSHLRISVDSFKPEVQRFALNKNVDYLNDIAGFGDPTVYDALAQSNCQLVIMHSIQQGIANRDRVSPDSILDQILGFFDRRIQDLTRAGINRTRIILDPGMGFFLGSDPECSYTVLRSLDSIRDEFSLPLLVSVSRKSFLGALTRRGPEERQAATLGAEIYLAENGVEFIRTHEPAPLLDALKVRRAIAGPTDAAQGII